MCESTFFSFSHTDEFQIVFNEECQSDSTIQCHLSPEISAVDMEIRWFKETDCVCFYKNRRLIEGESYKVIKRGSHHSGVLIAACVCEREREREREGHITVES